MPSASVLVLGATGNLGPHVVNALADQGVHTRVIVRNADRAREILPANVEVIEGDIENGTTLTSALDDVESVFLLTPHSYTMADLQLRVIRELRRSSVKIVKLSGTSSAIRPDGPQACRAHWEIEEVLKASGQHFVILRANAFMQTMINQIMLPAIRATGKMPNPIAGASLSMINGRDVGAVAAKVLTGSSRDGETIVLNGPRAVTYPEIAELIGQVRGEPIEVMDVTPADVRAGFIARGQAAWEGEHFEEMYQIFRDGDSSYVTDEVLNITGVAPGTIEEYIEANADAFRAKE